MFWLILLWIAVGVFGLLAATFAIGLLLPATHSASCSTRFERAPKDIYDAVTTWRDFPGWRRGIHAVEPRPATVGQMPGWVEITRHGKLPLQVIEMQSPHAQSAGRLVTRIDDTTLPFGGTWTWAIEPVDDGRACLVTIREDGQIRNAMFRFMARFVFGYRATMQVYLKDLQKKFQATATSGPA